MKMRRAVPGRIIHKPEKLKMPHGSKPDAKRASKMTPEPPERQPAKLATPVQMSLLDLTGPLLPCPLKDEREFMEELEALVKEPVEIRLTNNRSTVISIFPKKDAPKKVKVQHAFRAADRETMKALAHMIMHPNSKKTRPLIDAFILGHGGLISALAREAPSPGDQPKNRDLQKMLRKVLREHRLRVSGIKIEWSRGRGQRPASGIKFGSYSHESKTIKIHPELDDPEIPDYFVEYIIYHELLHELFPPARSKNGRITAHTGEFKKFEKMFNRCHEAGAYEKWYVENRLGRKVRNPRPKPRG